MCYSLRFSFFALKLTLIKKLNKKLGTNFKRPLFILNIQGIISILKRFLLKTF